MTTMRCCAWNKLKSTWKKNINISLSRFCLIRGWLASCRCVRDKADNETSLISYNTCNRSWMVTSKKKIAGKKFWYRIFFPNSYLLLVSRSSMGWVLWESCPRVGCEDKDRLLPIRQQMRMNRAADEDSVCADARLIEVSGKKSRRVSWYAARIGNMTQQLPFRMNISEN